MGVDQARHEEFARRCGEVDEFVLGVFQPVRGDDGVEGVCLDVVLDPDDVTIGSDGDQASGESEIASQRLGIDDGAIVEVDHGRK